MDVLVVLTALPHPGSATEYAPRPVQLSWYQADDERRPLRRS
jgi:uncharacterized protein YcgI (DUF1989 family)